MTGSQVKTMMIGGDPLSSTRKAGAGERDRVRGNFRDFWLALIPSLR